MQKCYTSKTIWIIIGLITYLIIQLNCASRGRPQGGPADTTPPVIIGTEPRPDSTGLVELDEISLYFSERMNESSVLSSIFFSPPLTYETDWSGGDELVLKLLDTLESDQTYVITIGSGAMDMQKNRMADSYQFAFSTGEKLNRGEIFGRVYGITEKDIFYVYGYRIVDPDSLNPTIVKADFLSQPGPDGNYSLRYLPESEFRIFVIEDQNKNLLLDLAFERVGIPIKDINVDSVNSPVGPLNFRITQIDTTRPEFSSARALDHRSVLLRFSEIVQMPSPEVIAIKDTLNGSVLPILDFTRSQDEDKQFILYTSLQDSGKGYRVFVSGLVDTSGNNNEQLQMADFIGSELVDTTKFELKRIEPSDSLQGARLSSGITLTFSIPLDTSGLSEGFQCLDRDSNLVSGIWTWKNISQGSFSPVGGFLPSQEYSFSIHSKYLFSLWGDTLADSTYNRVFFTLSEDDFGLVSGIYQSTIPENSSIQISLIPVDRNKTVYKTSIDNNTNFQFQRVVEGLYKFGGFVDLDKNGKFSGGNLFPFNYSEPYFESGDTLRVRKRWEISDIGFSIPGAD